MLSASGTRFLASGGREPPVSSASRVASDQQQGAHAPRSPRTSYGRVSGRALGSADGLGYGLHAVGAGLYTAGKTDTGCAAGAAVAGFAEAGAAAGLAGVGTTGSVLGGLADNSGNRAEPAGLADSSGISA